MSDEITVTITRLKAFVMSKASVKIFIDKEEIGKLKNGESMEFRTTAGLHQIEAKAISAMSGSGEVRTPGRGLRHGEDAARRLGHPSGEAVISRQFSSDLLFTCKSYTVSGIEMHGRKDECN